MPKSVEEQFIDKMWSIAQEIMPKKATSLPIFPFEPTEIAASLKSKGVSQEDADDFIATIWRLINRRESAITHDNLKALAHTVSYDPKLAAKLPPSTGGPDMRAIWFDQMDADKSGTLTVAEELEFKYPTDTPIVDKSSKAGKTH